MGEEPLTGLALILSDLGTIMTSFLSNAKNLVTWVSENPLVYLWVILAIIIAIISFVKGMVGVFSFN